MSLSCAMTDKQRDKTNTILGVQTRMPEMLHENQATLAPPGPSFSVVEAVTCNCCTSVLVSTSEKQNRVGGTW